MGASKIVDIETSVSQSRAPSRKMTSVGKKRESLILSIDIDNAKEFRTRNDFKTRNAETKNAFLPSETVEVHRLNPIFRRTGGNKFVEQTLSPSADSSIDTEFIGRRKKGNLTER